MATPNQINDIISKQILKEADDEVDSIYQNIFDSPINRNV